MTRPLVLLLASLLGALALAGTAPEGAAVGYQVLDLGITAAGHPETLTVAVWYPTRATPQPYPYGGPTWGRVAVDGAPDAGGGPYPLLVFSHGYGGGGIGSVFFTEALAGRGWIVAAPDHHDRHSAVRIRQGQVEDVDRPGLLRHAREIASSGPDQRDSFAYRLDEMRATLDGILASSRLGSLVDRDRIAVGGHSLGGFTALGLCGPLEARRDPRVRAVLLFSSGSSGYLYRDTELAAVQVPSMMLYGEEERTDSRGGESMAALQDKLYRNLPAPRYLLEVAGADHLSFNDGFSDRLASRWLSGTPDEHDVIRRYAMAFLERHVGGGAQGEATAVLDVRDGRLTRYERATGD